MNSKRRDWGCEAVKDYLTSEVTMEAKNTAVLLLDRTSGDHAVWTDALTAGQVQMQVSFVSSIATASRRLASGLYDAVVVHERAVGGRLLAFCRRIRLMDPKIVIVSSLARRRDWLEQELFGCGVDDVVSDQFSPSAVAVRIAVRLADRDRMGFERSGIRLGDVTIDVVRREVLRGDSRVLLTRRQAQLLVYFLNNSDRVISREELVENIWENTIDPNGKNLDMYVARLRKVLETDPTNPVHLLTVWSMGYRLVLDKPIGETVPQGTCQSTLPDGEFSE
jgi:DNA-binding response OmpR family regulator